MKEYKTMKFGAHGIFYIRLNTGIWLKNGKGDKIRFITLQDLSHIKYMYLWGSTGTYDIYTGEITLGDFYQGYTTRKEAENVIKKFNIDGEVFRSSYGFNSSVCELTDGSITLIDMDKPIPKELEDIKIKNPLVEPKKYFIFNPETMTEEDLIKNVILKKD